MIVIDERRIKVIKNIITMETKNGFIQVPFKDNYKINGKHYEFAKTFYHFRIAFINVFHVIDKPCLVPIEEFTLA